MRYLRTRATVAHDRRDAHAVCVVTNVEMVTTYGDRERQFLTPVTRTVRVVADGLISLLR